MARTEAQVAADTILALLHGRLLKPGRNVLSDASIAARVPMTELRAAAVRWDMGRRGGTGTVRAPDRAREVESDDATVATPEQLPTLPPMPWTSAWDHLGLALRGVADIADYLPDGIAIRGSRIGNREPGTGDPGPVSPEAPAPSKRRGGHRGPRAREEQQLCLACHRTKAMSRFRIANTDTGRRSRTCIPCEDDRRTRILDVTRDEPLGSVRLSFMVHEGDQVDGVCCVECEAKIKAGEIVYAHAALHHEQCPAWTGTQLRVPAAFVRRDR